MLTLKPEDAKRAMTRYRNALKEPEERKSVSEQLLDGFREAGFAVVHE